MKRLSVMVLVGLLVSGTVDQAQEPIPIFVGPQIRDGFTDIDRGILDSIDDIQDKLQDARQFTLVDTREEATLILEVTGRGLSGNAGAFGITTGGTTFGGGTIAGVEQPTFTSPAITTLTPVDRRAVYTILRVGGYEMTIVGQNENDPRWTVAAGEVVKDVAVWLDSNRTPLAEYMAARESQR